MHLLTSAKTKSTKAFAMLLGLSFSWSLTAKEISISVMDSQNAPVKNVVIYIESEKTVEKITATPATFILQKNRAFKPYISVAATNQPVIFRNDDNITHHIFSFNEATNFSFKLKPGESSEPFTFADKTTFPMACNIHDWMGGYLLVVNSESYTQTNSEGMASLKIPENEKVTIFAWHPQFDRAERFLQQTYQADNNTDKVMFKLKQEMQAIPNQENVDNFDYIEDY